MKFSDLFSGFGRDRTQAHAEGARSAAAPVPGTASATAAEAAVDTAAVAVPVPTAAAGGQSVVGKAPQSVEEIADLLGTINSVLTSESRNSVRIPCAALLSVLPEELRGPAYRSDAFPHANLRLERAELLEQLKTGRVSYRLGDLYHDVPAGWVVPEKDAVVALDLAQVVVAIPPVLFQVTAPQDPAVQKLVGGRDLFTPKRAFVPESERLPSPLVPATVPVPAQAALPAAAEVAIPLAPEPAPQPELAPVVESPVVATAALPVSAVAVVPAPDVPRPPVAPEVVIPAVPEPVPAPLAVVAVADIAAAAVPATAATPAAVPATGDKMPPGVAEIAGLLGVINSVLSPESRDSVLIPCAALLSVLPEGLRGPLYRHDAFPGANLRLDWAELLAQLKTGRVSYRLGELCHDLPAGWVLPEKETIVVLDLAQVVAAIPPARLQVTALQDPALLQLAGGRDLFTPKRAFAPEADRGPEPVVSPVVTSAAQVAAAVVPPPEPLPQAAVAPLSSAVSAETPPDIEASLPAPVPVAEVAPAEEVILANEKSGAKSVVPRDVQPVGWDGVEHSLADAAAGVDINSASAAALEALPGVGPSRAADIVAYRAAHGAFKHIFELAKVPGIGATLFRQMTGLALANASARHEVLSRLLELEGNRYCSLAEMLTRLATRLEIQGCVLAGEYGMTLARTAGVGDEAENYAATATQLFRRSQRYLRSLVGDAVECLHLPLAKPELLLFAAENFTLVMVLGRKRLSQAELRKTVAVVRELAWLLGRRAVVTEAP